MFPLDLIQSAAVDKLEAILSEVDHEVAFKNVNGNEWEVVISFDLDKTSLSEAQKALLGGLLKYL